MMKTSATKHHSNEEKESRIVKTSKRKLVKFLTTRVKRINRMNLANLNIRPNEKLGKSK